MFNPFDPDNWLNLLWYWRFFLPSGVGIATGIGLYRALGTPDAAALAAVAMVAGLIIGAAWELIRGSRKRPQDP